MFLTQRTRRSCAKDTKGSYKFIEASCLHTANLCGLCLNLRALFVFNMIARSKKYGGAIGFSR